MVIQCVSHNSLQEDVEEGGGEHTALSYPDCGSEPVPYAGIKIDCADGLVIEVLWWPIMLHAVPCRTPSLRHRRRGRGLAGVGGTSRTVS